VRARACRVSVRLWVRLMRAGVRAEPEGAVESSGGVGVWGLDPGGEPLSLSFELTFLSYPSVSA